MSDEHVDRAVADDLVGDAAIECVCEAGLWDLGHGRTVCRAQPRGARPTDLK
jgi:hypothetical protein